MKCVEIIQNYTEYLETKNKSEPKAKGKGEK